MTGYQPMEMLKGYQSSSQGEIHKLNEMFGIQRPGVFGHC
jgi:hypothetical protein